MSGKTPKEEEEDQWISGEELRTEGSSDEDATEPRASRKKQKTDVLLKRLLVSSLAFPSPPSPRTRLPKIEKTDKVVKPDFSKEKEERLTTAETASSALLGPGKSRVNFQVGGDSPPTTTFSEEAAAGNAPTKSQPKSLQKFEVEDSPSTNFQRFGVGDSPSKIFSTEEAARSPLTGGSQPKRLQEPVLHPRKPRVTFELGGDSPATDYFTSACDAPKSLQESLRRSLKVELSKRHHYEKGETKSTNHLILEMNEFYFEMLDRLKFLRGNLHKKDRDEDDDLSEWGFETTDPQVLSILAEIEMDEAEYQQNVQLLAKEKQERKTILQEICASGERSQTTAKEGEGDADEVKAEPEKIGDADGGNQQRRAKAKGEKDFVTKNKELAKEYGAMSRVCLTDEEKIKLESLLSDVDDAEIHVQEEEEEAAAALQDDDLQDGFKLDLDEQKTLDELESKLKALSEYVEPSDAQKEIDDLSAAENQGKHWKFSLMQNRLKSIDNDLCILQDEKEKEGAVSKLEELASDDETEYRKCLSDLAMRFDGDTREEAEAEEKEDADNRENYQECLSQINLKIEEAREEFERKSSSK